MRAFIQAWDDSEAGNVERALARIRAFLEEA